MNPKGPKLTLPDPLSGLERGSFAHYTLSERLPNIALGAIEDYEWSPQAIANLKKLAADMPDGRLGDMADDNAPDRSDWNRHLEPYREQTWLQAPWFAAETYFFRRLIAASGYFREGSGKMVDPYARIKQSGLLPVHNGLRDLYEGLQTLLPDPSPSKTQLKEALAYMLRMNVWGNKADLSLFPAAGSDQPFAPAIEDLSHHLLVDHAQAISKYLTANQEHKGRVDIVLDNGGLELAYDLALADFLLGYEVCRFVYLHTKPFPTYVSDATTLDVLAMIDYMSEAPDRTVQKFAQRLVQSVQNGNLIIKSVYFWTSPLNCWQMPGGFSQELAGTDLVISKGDANYRRWLGDLRWPFDTPLDGILNYLSFPLLFLRVFKSNCLAGLKPGQQEEVEKQDPDWLYNGGWGVIQAYFGSKAGQFENSW